MFDGSFQVIVQGFCAHCPLYTTLEVALYADVHVRASDDVIPAPF